MAELSDSIMLLQYQYVENAKFDVAKLMSGELTVSFVFLVGMCSSSTTKSDETISSSNFKPRESVYSSKNHRALCALASPNSCFACVR